MGSDNRQDAYEYLIDLANKQGYVTFDEIMDCADGYDLPIQDFDWLSNSITSRGILVYSEAPSSASTTDEDEYDDFAHSDYEKIYKRIIELSPQLDRFVYGVKEIIPPQRKEIGRLKYQVLDGNEYARKRMIEMHLRLALRIGLKRADFFNIDIEDTICDACIGLIIAVDKFVPDISGAFGSYAALWVLQNIQREQVTSRPNLYYPDYIKDKYLTIYPILKRKGCITCFKFSKCKKALQVVINKLKCDNDMATKVISSMVPDLSLESFVDYYVKKNNLINDKIAYKGDLLAIISPETELSEDDILEKIYKKDISCIVRDLLKRLKPREEFVIKQRYGFDGDEQTLEKIGKKIGVTRERVRQIESKALKKIENIFKEAKIEKYLI